MSRRNRKAARAELDGLTVAAALRLARVDVAEGEATSNGQVRSGVDGLTVAAALGLASVDVFEGGVVLGTDAAARLEGEPRGAHAVRDTVPTDAPRGAHVNRADALRSVESRALHARKADPVVPLVPSPSAPEPCPPLPRAAVAATPVITTVATVPEREAPAPTRPDRPMTRRGGHAFRGRWGFVPVASALGAVAVGLGGGAAYAYYTGGPESNVAATGSPVTVEATATTGAADLLPGRAGAVYFTLHNANSFGATFDEVAPGATVVSDNAQLCPSSYVSIAQKLPYAVPSSVTVSPGGTSGMQAIANLVMLAPNAPGTCQGVTFTVHLTLSGQSS